MAKFPDYLGSPGGSSGGGGSRGGLNKSASSASVRQETVAGQNTALPVVYGTDIVGAKIAWAMVHAGKLVLIVPLCLGEIESVDAVYVDGKTPPTGFEYIAYTGAAGQPADPWLVAAFAAQTPPVSYSDTLDGVAYLAVRVTSGATSGFPKITAKVSGMKVYDPRTALTAWSDNPSLCAADFIVNASYGMGKSVDWTSVGDCADWNDNLIGTAPDTEKHRTIGLSLINVQQCNAWLDTLCVYAGILAVPEGDDYRFIANKPAASVFTFDASNILDKPMIQVQKRGVRDLPTVMEITYTDTSVDGAWKDDSVRVYAAGVLAGTTPRRESKVSLPGVQRYSQARREAIERLNLLTVSDLTVSFVTFDEAVQIQVGDVITVTHPIGLAAKELRVVSAEDKGFARWAITATEYDATAYNTDVVAGPSTTDTNLPTPTDPPTVTGLTLAEEVFQMENGTWSSRIRATWDAAVFPFIDHYLVDIKVAGAVVQTYSVHDAVCASAAVQEGVAHTVEVSVASSVAVGTAASQSITPAGKYLVPGDVPSLYGFEVGGEVHLWWGAAVDIDIWKYEIRYGLTSGSWATARLLNRTQSLRLVVPGEIPAGTWRFYVKAIDSVGQYSATAKSIDLTVTLDSDAYLAGTVDFVAPTLSNAESWSNRWENGALYYQTDMGETFSSLFPAAMDTYTEPLASYHGAGASELLSETHDFGLQLSGNWTAAIDLQQLSGTVTAQIEISADAVTWYASDTLKMMGSARYARVRVSAADGGTFLVGPTLRVTVDASAREETGSATSAASGPHTVTLNNQYQYAKSINVTPLGTTAASATVDNVVTGNPTTFDVYIFDSTGSQVARDFGYSFKGV